MLARILLAVWVLTACPASAGAALTAYSEGPGDVPVVRPPGGANHWYWEAVNRTNSVATICFHWRKGDGPSVTPYDGSPWQEPAAEGQLPPDGCDPSPLAAGERAAYDWQLPSLEHRAIYTFCATEWVQDGSGAWSEVTKDARSCSAVRVDTSPPVVGVVLSDRAGRQGATNDPVGLRRTITYADDTSVAAGDTRVCRVSNRQCLNNGRDPFDYDRDCSDEATGMSTTFTCGWAWPYGDQVLHQCALSFDGALADRAPDLTRAPAADNPDYSAPGTGNFAIGCDAIRIDRSPPALVLSALAPGTPGGPVRLQAAGADDATGLSGRWRFDFGDGATAESDDGLVEHRYADPGAKRIVLTRTDGAGNLGSAQTIVIVEEPLVVGAPARLPGSARTVRVTARVERAGRLYIELRRHGRRVSFATRELSETAWARLPFPRRGSRSGTYSIRIAFTPAGRARPTARRTLALRVLPR